MSQNKILVYPPTVPYDSMRQTPHAIMHGFHKLGYTCYYCDTDTNRKNYLDEVEKDFFVCGDYNKLKQELKNKKVTLYITWAKHHTEIKDFNTELTIYHYLDYFKEWEPYQKDMKEKADIIISTAKLLYEEALAEYPDKTYFVTNGCDFNFFSNPDTSKLFSDILKIKKPIIYYHGALASWLDVDLLEETAQLLPQCSFIFIGKKLGCNLVSHKNIYWLGEKSYSDLPNYIKYADVCIIPFILNKTILSTNPIKFYEYLAAGKGVVSTEIPELFPYKNADILKLAVNAKDFAAKITEFLEHKSPPEIIKVRQTLAKKNSWDSKVKEILESINNLNIDISKNRGSLQEIKESLLNIVKKSALDKSKKRVAILTRSFYDFEGKNIFFGGGERYLIDLCSILKSLGYDVDIFQFGKTQWKNTYKGFTFQSILGGAGEIDAIPGLTSEFNEITKDYDYHIYFSFDICYPQVMPNSIAISHGISFDGPGVSGRGTQKWYDILRKCIENPAKIITVDTNTINWARTAYQDITDKFVYIPNYVDIEEFYPTRIEKDITDFKVLFPRRIIKARGWLEAKKAVDILANKYPCMSFYFVGKGFSDRDEKDTLDWANNFKNNNVFYSWVEMDNMSNVYKDKDLIVIPTLWSEGTSLSCLEAMASGKPVISSCVGGLQNLIVNNYNGILLEYVSPEALIESIENLYFNREKCKLFGKRNREISEEAFNKERWVEQWKNVIKTYFQ